MPLVAANWKMHMTRAEAGAFCDAFLPEAEQLDGVEVVLCPPATALAEVALRCGGTGVRVAAQNMHAEPSGAFTGELSAAMLVDAGAWGVILGHSERRRLFGETDEALARKLPAALGSGLVPILCVGETEDERDREQTESVLRRQIEADLATADADQLRDLVIAYEPVWAIGTGRTATSGQAQEACSLIRSLISARDAGAAEAVRILYGGSVKPDNAEELIAQPDIDGALVGGASLDPDGFAAICRAAR
ncbi:MAG: triose-phosphate isomerase [Solirubrobacterales bacterium]